METVYDQKPLRGGGFKLFRRIILPIILIVAALIFASNCTYTIKEQEQAVLITLGIAQPVTESGLHFKIPFIQQVRKVNTTIQGFSIGYDSGNNTNEAESLMITSDYNFVNVDFFVEYKISDPVKAIYASEQPIVILKNISQSCIRSVIGSYDVDSVLTTGKNEIQATIKERIIEQLALHDIGIQLVNITIQDSEPPTVEVMEAFKAVETAKQGKETSINNANKYRNEKLPEAEAKVDQILQNAEATKEQRINEANGEVARFNAMYEEYVKNPVITRQRMFYEAMEDILPSLKVIINGSETAVDTILPLESFVTDTASTGTGTADTSSQQ
ncbi:MAG: FtsH protease activity modulator HflK [Lachnospiraceae bacterium]|nr:FtsH protease activity modulator HflK [Lachnospiraceae bacterium]